MKPATSIISARVPSELFVSIDSLPGKRTEHVIAALALYSDSFRSPPKVECIPTPKKYVTWKPLSKYTRSRLRVLRQFCYGSNYTLTSSELSYRISESTNNISKRLSELCSEGYIEPNGEYRKSRNSGKMLTVWQRTSKPLPEELTCR